MATKNHIINNSDIKSWKELQDKTTLKQKQKVRDILYNNITIIDAFIQENPQKFTQTELMIIKNWKYFFRGEFYIIQYLKEYAIFLSTQKPEKAYGVKALQDDFDTMLPYDPPVLVDAVLLPFKEYIVYDGILFSSNIIFGAGIRRDLQQTYQEAKSRSGIVTSLPESIETKKSNDEELLKFYLKSDKNHEYYTEEIVDLLDKHPSLTDVYYQELGKSDARKFVRRFHEIGIKNVWYATLRGIIVASGMTKEELEKQVEMIVPKNKIKQIHIFRVK
ncbi:MAG TPA: hypothetical protein VMR41_03355 [Patescibacteria group bacterium]|nr:hypothetical protein [Patescibacteria group bacterium]